MRTPALLAPLAVALFFGCGSDGGGTASTTSTFGSGGTGGASSSSSGAGGTSASSSSGTSASSSGGTSASSSSSGTSASSSSGTSTSSSGGPTCGLPGACVYAYPWVTVTGSQSGIDYTICPGGPDPSATPPRCIVEVDFGNASLSVSGGPQQFTITGTIPLRIADLPMSGAYAGGSFSTDMVVDTGSACPGGVQAFVPLSVQATVTQTGSGPMVVGCSTLTVATLTLDQAEVSNATGICGGNIPPALVSQVKAIFAQTVASNLRNVITQGIQGEACLH